jgi:hypothetical protein
MTAGALGSASGSGNNLLLSSTAEKPADSARHIVRIGRKMHSPAESQIC